LTDQPDGTTHMDAVRLDRPIALAIDSGADTKKAATDF
jgi:hypothetical protein